MIAENSTNDVASRALRLIEYLEKLARLRTTLIRRVDQYESLLWFHHIPSESGCYSILWDLSAEEQGDRWIQVEQQREPPLPPVPEICRQWVDERTLRNALDKPELLPTIIAPDSQITSENSSETEPEVSARQLHLVDYPDVVQAWNIYQSHDWEPWAERHRKWETVHAVYSKLYEIHKAQQRLGEEYELIVGLGLLCWRTPSGHDVLRHAITGRCELDFEPVRSRFTVKPHEGGVNLSVELDMLDVTDQPSGLEERARNALEKAENDPWDQNVVNEVLLDAAASLSDRGEYFHDNLGPEGSASTKPILSFAPALILRRRTQRGLLEVLKAMRNRIPTIDNLPPEFHRLCEGPVESEESDGLPHNNGESVCSDVGRVYFPLPTNEEQRRIARAITARDSVLVQGPPGTGKSHTITNLIGLVELFLQNKRKPCRNGPTRLFEGAFRWFPKAN